MIIKIETGEGYDAIWNNMHSMFVPCRERVIELGKTYEDAKERFYDYAKNRHDNQDVLSAEIYTLLMDKMDEAHAALRPFKDEWWRARYGLGLN
jgi:hypothetical protein